jgi:hypothetical protein
VSERIYCGWKEMAEALRRPGRRAPSVDSVKRWVARAVNPLPAYHDAQGWYLRHSEAVVWLNQSTVPGHVQMARLRDRRRERSPEATKMDGSMRLR